MLIATYKMTEKRKDSKPIERRRETIDIEDVEFEECDLKFDTLFPSSDEGGNNTTDYGPNEYDNKIT